MPSSALALAHDSMPICSEVSTTLTVSAGVAYEVFADVGETPRWLPIVQSARVLVRDTDGRPLKASFLARMDRASIGYTLEYSYNAKALVVGWSTPSTSSVMLTGEARFMPLSARACLMTYRLVMEMPSNAEWAVGSYDGHPASSVVADFREHLRRIG